MTGQEAEAPAIRTAGEIADLKASWRRDPNWDLEETEGFEAHRDELTAYRLAHEAERAAHLNARAGQMGCSPQVVLKIEALEHRLRALEAAHFVSVSA